MQKRIHSSVGGLDARSVQKKLEDIKTKHPKTHRGKIRPFEFSSTSRKAAGSNEVVKTVKK
ncbi:MAG: hypothetical protein HKM93_11070 [Desulfobacteraceae bacterium]|nr:hypothetical protein [Desulfobacteraceae bacterium]